MKAKKIISVPLFALIILLSICDGYSQNCKKAFWSAKEQYKSGRFESAQKLLNACIEELNGNNKSHYQKNPDQVYRVYKLYISACSKSRNSACVDRKKNELVAFFPGKKRKDVIDKLNNTSI